MRRDVLEYWCKALESGKYKQGKGALRSGDRFCCLGVLCDIGNGGGQWYAGAYHPPGWNDSTENPSRYGLNFQMLGLTGLSYSIQCKAQRMNDDGATFPEIAAWLRANVPTEDE